MSSSINYSKNLEKYISNYAEPECKKLPSSLLHYTYQHCIAVPCYDESTAAILALTNSQTSSHLLFIIVVNTPETTDLKAAERTINLINALEQQWDLLDDQTPGIKHLRIPETGNHTLLIERTQRTKPIPTTQGVGLARKIGFDIACQLYRHERLTSKWVRSTDADVTLPQNYMLDLSAYSASAVTYRFEHKETSNAKLNLAIALYELKMHYYVTGLAQAGSSYAFYSIGSAQAINLEAYASVRGFPKRSGGEDFYLLNKLVKIAPIEQISTVSVQIETRTSCRVPFGTGPELSTMMKQDNLLTTYPYYHPMCFKLLNAFHDTLQQLWLESPFNNRLELTKEKFRLTQKEVDLLDKGFISLKAQEQLIKHKPQCKSFEHWTKRIDQWLDGFKSLKFIHFLQNSGVSPINYITLKKTITNDFPLNNSALKQAIEKVEKYSHF